MKSFRKNKTLESAGFTIVEIVVAIGVLCVGILGLSLFFSGSGRISRSANYISVGANLAQGVLEEEIAKSYEELVPATGSKILFSDDESNPYHLYQKQVNVTLIDSNLNQTNIDIGLKKIEVYVYWNESGVEKNVHLATIKSER